MGDVHVAKNVVADKLYVDITSMHSIQHTWHPIESNQLVLDVRSKRTLTRLAGFVASFISLSTWLEVVIAFSPLSIFAGGNPISFRLIGNSDFCASSFSWGIRTSWTGFPLFIDFCRPLRISRS